MAVPAAIRARPRLWGLSSAWGQVLGRALLPLICLLPVLLYLPFLSEPFEKDEGTYATVAQGLLRGDLPYRDLFDHKPPLVYVWYAFSFSAFGEDVTAPRLVAALVWSATALLVFLAGRAIYDRRAGLMAAALFSVSSGLVLLQANANTEVFMLLPLVASLYAFTRAHQTGDDRWLLVAGVCGGLAALTKQVAALNLAGLALFLIVTEARARQYGRLARGLGLLAGGSALVLAVALIPFALGGALDDFYYATVTYNQLYVGRLSPGDRLTLAIRYVPDVLLAAALPAGLTLLALLEMRRAQRSRLDYLLVLSFGASFVGVIWSGFFFPHYFVGLLPFAALLSARFVTTSSSQTGVSRRAFLATIGLLAAVSLAANLPVFLEPTPEAKHAAKFPSALNAQENTARQVAAYVAGLTRPEDTIYEYGRNTEIYFYADRRPATRFMYDRPFRLDESTFDEAMRQLQEARPAYIIDSIANQDAALWESQHPKQYLEFLASNYDYVGQVSFARVYRLKDAAR